MGVISELRYSMPRCAAGGCQLLMMNALGSGEILEGITRHLSDPLDISTSSVVNRGWRAASRAARVTCLNFPGQFEPPILTMRVLRSLTQWFQAQQSKICQLSTLRVWVEVDEYTEDICQMFCSWSPSLFMLAGAWPLQDVTIVASFNFDAAVALLPACVKHLKLCPDADNLPKVVHLTDFCRFTAVETLTIYVHCSKGDIQPGNAFILSTVLAQLTNLTLSNWPFELEHGCSLAVCLPKLAHASLHLPVDLLQGFLVVNSVKVLYLILVDLEPVPLEGVLAVVPSCNQLRSLDLRQSSKNENQPHGLQIRCQA